MSNSQRSAHNATRLFHAPPPPPNTNHPPPHPHPAKAPPRHTKTTTHRNQPLFPPPPPPPKVSCPPPCLHPNEDKAYLQTVGFAELQNFHTHNLHRSQQYALAFIAFHLNFVQNIWLHNTVSTVSDCYNILHTFENYVNVVLWTRSMSSDVQAILFTSPTPLLLLTSPRRFLLVNKICLLQHINFTRCHSETE
jgi:hypothetical protein